MENGRSSSSAVGECRLIVAGLGGQGVIFLTRLLAQAAAGAGRPLLVSETHGMSQRGGAVISHLRLGGGAAPLIRRGTADLLLALEENEAVRNLPYVRPGGVALANSSNGLPAVLAGPLERLAIRLFCLPGDRLAAEAGAPRALNVFMAGFACAHPALTLSLAQLQAGLGAIGGRNQAVNMRALEAGYQAGQEQTVLDVKRDASF
jgi:indolepyruvate ferredoxin oxidoreductase, beta subunit